jgi:hypothetical protein
MPDTAPLGPSPGLCESCRHARVILSGKGSRFFYCTRAETDESYPKYPRLPVLHCPSYETPPASPSRN